MSACFFTKVGVVLWLSVAPLYFSHCSFSLGTFISINTEYKQLSEVDWIMFSIGFVFIFMSLGILGLKPETIYTLKMSYLDEIENVVW